MSRSGGKEREKERKSESARGGERERLKEVETVKGERERGCEREMRERE